MLSNSLVVNPIPTPFGCINWKNFPLIEGNTQANRAERIVIISFPPCYTLTWPQWHPPFRPPPSGLLTRKCVNWTAAFSQRSCKCATSWACPGRACPRRLSEYLWRQRRRCCCDSLEICLQQQRRLLRCLLMWRHHQRPCPRHWMRSKLSNCHQMCPMKFPDCCRRRRCSPSMWPIVMPQLSRGSKQPIVLKVATF